MVGKGAATRDESRWNLDYSRNGVVRGIRLRDSKWENRRRPPFLNRFAWCVAQKNWNGHVQGRRRSRQSTGASVNRITMRASMLRRWRL